MDFDLETIQWLSKHLSRKEGIKVDTLILKLNDDDIRTWIVSKDHEQEQISEIKRYAKEYLAALAEKSNRK